jgi:hypothetical protein
VSGKAGTKSVAIRLSPVDFKRLEQAAQKEGGLKPGVQARRYVLKALDAEVPA